MTLMTERLILRPFEMDDFAEVHAYASSLENIRYMVWGPNTEDDTQNFIELCLTRALKEPRKDYDFAVCLKGAGELIGGCGVYLDGKEGMLGWTIHKDHWKKGYGTELAAELLKFGFEELGLHRMYATCDAENYGSYRVMERNGMRREGHFIANRDIRGEWRDEYLYAMLEGEWEARKEG